MSSIFLDGGPGQTVFDSINSREVTPGSGNGIPFTITGGIGTPSAVTAPYSSPLGLNGNAPLGDLLVTLNIDFGG